MTFEKKCELCYANRIWRYENGFRFKADSQEAIYDRKGELYKPAIPGEPNIMVGRRGTCIIPETVVQMMHLHNLRVPGTMKARMIGKKMVNGVEHVRYTNGGKMDWLPVVEYPKERLPSFILNMLNGG